MDDSNNSMRLHLQDPYTFFPQFSRISISQEHLFQTTPLVGDTSPNNRHHDTPSEIDAGIIPLSSAPILILSPPDTNQDVFHTPPENPLLPSSDIDVPHSTGNQSVDVDAEAQLFVDLAGVSPENSRFVGGDGLAEIHYGEFRVLEREISELGQAPVKKLKLGFDSLGNSNAVECEHVKVDSVNNEDLCQEAPVVEHSVLETQAVQFQNAEAVVEGSGMREDPVLQMLQKELESGKDKGKQKFSVFDVLKVLSDNSKEDEDEDGDGLTVLEAAKLAGITFPRPSWWPDHYVSKIFNFDDDQVKK
ncbi:unnamed protein product [Lathyrus oleraceus]|uniref:uncharacterized protein LOC127087641 n=1 Tax=Pisum sativum TaxID=3888 RepID=UPI0021D2CC3A|nr:uncharacterized protein LOC127087641 [Pisum sativum]